MKKISVITINYNNLEGLKRTIPTVLSQTYNDFEYIVIDGGSTDGSKEYIESQQGIDYWVSEKDAGIYNAMNKGICVAKGEYCIFMNSGDHFFSTNSLEHAAPELDGTDFCIGGTIYVDHDKAELIKAPTTMSLDYIIGNFLSHQSTFTKTQLLKNCPYDETLKITSDWKYFFESWYLHNASYKTIKAIVSTYYLDGISSIDTKLSMKERNQIIKSICNGNRKADKKKMTRLERRKKVTIILAIRLERAMKLKPLARDWKIMRNGGKAFFKDLFL